MDTSPIFEFEPFILDVKKRELLRDGTPIPLKPKALDLLMVLIKNRDRVVEKEELMRRVWPDSEVEENNLTVQKRALVAVLGHGYIQTVPRCGYRFVAEVRELCGDGATSTDFSVADQQCFTKENDGDEHHPRFSQEPTLQLEVRSERGVVQVPGRWKRPALIGLTALLLFGAAAFVWHHITSSNNPPAIGRMQVRSPSDEAEVMQVVKESQIYETLGIYTHPEAFDRSQLDKFWMSVEQGGKAVPAIEAAVERLRKKGWRYADESKVEIFDFRYVRIFSPRDYAEVGTSERWYVPTVWLDGRRVENRNVYLGTYDVDYTLQKIDGRWLIEENSTPRPKSNSNQNK
jgi:DNA-binding winged helix-turn-helix (wHTH) protein